MGTQRVKERTMERVDPSLWQRADMRVALAARDIAGVFRLLQMAGVSQRRIAALTGQSQSEISEILAGRQVVSYDVLARIADGLGVARGTLGLAIGIRLEQGVQFGLGRWRRCSVGQRLILVRSGRWRLRSETESRRESGRETGLPIRLPVRRVRAGSVRRARTFSRCLVFGAAPEAPASRRRRLRWSAGVAWLGRGGGPVGRNPPRLGSGICRRRTG